ncbi:hypothetical protein [Actinomadura sp. LOL_011]|uniref:hypothetical protein n=1 Tax=Actinomadura sp. LOL_011 TaxID=3345410 RepID=UPI003A80AC95
MPCPGGDRYPAEATIGGAAAPLGALVDQLPVCSLHGEPVVRLADIYTAIDRAAAQPGPIPSRGASHG